MNELKLPYCPRCDRIMVKEGSPFNGLSCECGIGYTYSFAVRKGYVEEIILGEKRIALESWHTRNRLGRKVKS